MTSFHRADWLSLSQTIGTLIAIAGAYGVAFFQSHLERRRRKTEADELARQYLTLAHDFIFDAARAVNDLYVYRKDPLKTETNSDRVRFRSRIAQSLEALLALQIEKIPTIAAVRKVIQARAELAYALNEINVNSLGQGGHVACNEAYGQPLQPMVEKLHEASTTLSAELASLKKSSNALRISEPGSAP
jgi:hypothetical protein